MSEIEGRIFQHELLHLQGSTYINLIFNQLKFVQLEKIISVIKFIKSNPLEMQEQIDNLKCIFRWGADNQISFEENDLERVLRHTEPKTFIGIEKLAMTALVAKQQEYSQNLFCSRPFAESSSHDWNSIMALSITEKDGGGPGYGF